MKTSRRQFFRLALTSYLFRFWIPPSAEAQMCDLPLPINQAQPFILPQNPMVVARPGIQEFSQNLTLVQDLRNAVAAMKQLTPSNPLNWDRQTSLHCAMCAGGPSTLEDIHFTWSFLP